MGIKFLPIMVSLGIFL